MATTEELVGTAVIAVCQYGNHRSVHRGVIEPYDGEDRWQHPPYRHSDGTPRKIWLVTTDGQPLHLPPINGTLLSITVINEEKGLLI